MLQWRTYRRRRASASAASAADTLGSDRGRAVRGTWPGPKLSRSGSRTPTSSPWVFRRHRSLKTYRIEESHSLWRKDVLIAAYGLLNDLPHSRSYVELFRQSVRCCEQRFIVTDLFVGYFLCQCLNTAF
jgi:hypothetical protein